MLKAAIIGCNYRGKMHAEAYEHMDDADVVACCDLRAERRDPLAEQFGLKGYDDFEQMIRTEQPDMVHLVTPPNVRLEVMQVVSDLGVPMCTVEKPISTGVEDWLALNELERASQTKFAICHQFRWLRDLMTCQKAVADGAIGDVMFLDISAGMNILGQGTHTLNYGRSLIGDPKVVQVFGNIGEWEEGDRMHPGPATTEAMLTFDNGVRGLWTSGRVSPRLPQHDNAWQHVRVAAYGDVGRVNWEEYGNWEVISGGTRNTGQFGDMDAFYGENIQSQAGFHKAVIKWHEKGVVPGTNLADSLHEWATVLALFQSALTHQPVDMNDFEPMPDLIQQVQKFSV